MAPAGLAESLVAPLADMLGARAPAWFGVALIVVLVASALAWWLAERLLRRRPGEVRPTPVQVVLRVATGFAVIVAAALGFAELAEAIGEGETLARFDERLARQIAANMDPTSLRWFAAVTRLGDTLTLTVLCVAVAVWLLARRRRGLAAGWIAAVAGNGLLNQTLKSIFERVRPLHEHGLVQAAGWSFPSGHSSGSVAAYGMLAYILVRTLPLRWHLPAVLLAAALAFTVGSSRVMLQVHFASDVAAGFLSGLAWLTVCVASVELARRYRGK